MLLKWTNFCLTNFLYLLENKISQICPFRMGTLKFQFHFFHQRTIQNAHVLTTLNRKLAYAMLSEQDDLNQNKLLSSIAKKYLNYIYFSDSGPKNSRFFLFLEDDKELIWKTQHWRENYALKCFSKRLIYIKTNFFFTW